MNPIEAYNYMKVTGKSIRAERTPPWINNPRWIDWHYSVKDGSVIASYNGKTVNLWEPMTWIDWWYNFCYNNDTNKTELIEV